MPSEEFQTLPEMDEQIYSASICIAFSVSLKVCMKYVYKNYANGLCGAEEHLVMKIFYVFYTSPNIINVNKSRTR
jgi:hypothetical protein